MASFYSSNCYQDHDNYQYYQDHDNYQYYQSYNCESHEPRYVQSYDHTQFYGSYAYQQVPTQSLVGYHYSAYTQPDALTSKNPDLYGNNGDFYDPVTTQFVISYSTNGPAVNDLDFEEYNPEPFKGGYSIDEAYGKALPPSDDICYPCPPTKIDLISPSLGDPCTDKSVPQPSGEEEKKSEGVEKPTSAIAATNVIQDESEFGSDEDEDDYEEDDEEEDDNEEEELGNSQIPVGGSGSTNVNVISQVVQEESASKSDKDEDEDEDGDEEEFEENVGELGDDQARNEGGDGKEIRRQIPPGYGLEAMDLCEGLFGGYFPCLLKRNKASYEQHGGNQNRDVYDYGYDCCQGTVDYLFGNPNPYGGAMPERGSYGDPVYSYHRYHPQPSMSGQVQYGGEDSSWLNASRYYNGQ